MTCDHYAAGECADLCRPYCARFEDAASSPDDDRAYEYVVRYRTPMRLRIYETRTVGRARLEELKAERHGSRQLLNAILSVRRVPLAAYEDVTEAEGRVSRA